MWSIDYVQVPADENLDNKDKNPITPNEVTNNRNRPQSNQHSRLIKQINVSSQDNSGKRKN